MAYLHAPDHDLRRELWVLDLETRERRRLLAASDGFASEGEFAPHEALLRERARVRTLGVTGFGWMPRVGALQVRLPGRIELIDPADGTRRTLLATDAEVLDPQPSPDGRRLAFVRDRELWCVDLDDDGCGVGAPRRLTEGADEGVSHGLADYLAQEELGRSSGFWWSADGETLAFARVDESALPWTYLTSADQTAVERHRYSFAGGPIPAFELGLVAAAGGAPRWLDAARWDGSYLARAGFAPGGVFVAQLLSRTQRELELVAFEPDSDEPRIVLCERGAPWLNLHDDLRWLESGKRLLWSHERDGLRRLEVRDAEGGALHPIAAPAGMVHGVVAVDEAGGLVWYVAADDPRERHLFRAALDGSGAAERWTREPGTHRASFGPGPDWWVHGFDSVSTPPRVTLERLDGGESFPLHEADPDPRVARLALRPPELVEVPLPGDDGVLYGALYAPAERGAGERLPLVVSVYGGPRAQAVVNGWGLTADLRAQRFAECGFLVLKLDNRGAWGRGLDFEAAIAGRAGQLEVSDQARGVAWLVQRGLADPERVGICGWSYGGYMAVSCLAREPDVFRAGAAGAPVIRWEDYDSAYTERYMGVPQAWSEASPFPADFHNPEGYREASPLEHLDGLRGRLLVVHGLRDENVLFRNSAALLDACAQRGLHVDLWVLPGERHSVRERASCIEVERRFFEHLADALGVGPESRPD
ncbi:MAG: DPP IV N-terminal domain-containing protein [Myxococcota bacterium]|nr:DPP IV N-terminal domain-containing protein [Myxococcota bacterium]